MHPCSTSRTRSIAGVYPELSPHLYYSRDSCARCYSISASLRSLDWSVVETVRSSLSLIGCTMPRSYHLPPPDLAEDQPAVDIPPEDQPPTVEHIEEPQAPAPPAPATTAPVPPAPVPSVPPMPSVPLVPSTTMPTAHLDIAGPSTSAQPQQSITISTQDFLIIVDAVRIFSATSSSFATAHAALEDRMTHTEAAMA